MEPLPRAPPPHNQTSSTPFYEKFPHPNDQKNSVPSRGQRPKAARSITRQIVPRIPPNVMASFKPPKPVASTTWKPGTVLEIGEVTDDFHCIGHTKQQKPCENPNKKDNRTHAKEILLVMSTIYPALNAVKDELEDELKDKLEDLGDILLCWRHRKDTEQVKSITGKWTRAIQEFVRKGGDEVMGEPHDTISSLDAEISDLMERRLRLVHMGEHTQIKSERRGAGFK